MPLLPPPPGQTYNPPRAPPGDDIARNAQSWHAANPFWPPRVLWSEDKESISSGYSTFIASDGLIRHGGTLDASPSGRAGCWMLTTQKGQQDGSVFSATPLYAPGWKETPLQQALRGPGVHLNSESQGGDAQAEKERIAYFEVKVVELDRKEDSGVAIGFIAPPYPMWRLPGWERGSIGVHGDDGRRYVYDNEDGKGFTKKFNEGETVGIGMRFTDSPEVEVFFTRNGLETGSWKMPEHAKKHKHSSSRHEGLVGDRDLHAAVGFFGKVKVELVTAWNNWMWQPSPRGVKQMQQFAATQQGVVYGAPQGSHNTSGNMATGAAIGAAAGAATLAGIAGANHHKEKPTSHREMFFSKLHSFHSHDREEKPAKSIPTLKPPKNNEQEQEEEEKEDESSSSSDSDGSDDGDAGDGGDDDGEGGGAIHEIISGISDVLSSLGE